MACYRAGAYRACIVMTWEAIVFDIIAKVRELSMAENKAASALVEKLDRMDIPSALQFEANVLREIEDLQLLDPSQSVALLRVKEDRNLCAHPSMTREGEPYQPSPETARAHIRNAVEHLLRHPPVQGKHALGRLLEDLRSDYFPDSWQKAKAHLERSPLRRAKVGLVKDWLRVLLKDALGLLDKPFVSESRLVAALRATREMYPEVCEEFLVEELDQLVEKVRRKDHVGKKWVAVLCVLSCLPGSYDCLSASCQSYLERYLTDGNDRGRSAGIGKALDIPQLQALCLEQLPLLEFPEYFELVGLRPDRALLDGALSRLRTASNWGYADRMLQNVVLPHERLLTQADVAHILDSGKLNDQVRGSFSYGKILDALRHAGRLPTDIDPGAD